MKKKTKQLLMILGGALLLGMLFFVGRFVFLIIRRKEFAESVVSDPQVALDMAYTYIDFFMPEGYSASAVDEESYDIILLQEDAPAGRQSAKPTIAIINIDEINEETYRLFTHGPVKLGIIPFMGYDIDEAWRYDYYRNTFEVQGEEVKYDTYYGLDNSDRMLNILMTDFVYLPDGYVKIYIIGEDEYWDWETIDAFIDSIH